MAWDICKNVLKGIKIIRENNSCVRLYSSYNKREIRVHQTKNCCDDACYNNLKYLDMYCELGNGNDAADVDDFLFASEAEGIEYFEWDENSIAYELSIDIYRYLSQTNNRAIGILIWKDGSSIYEYYQLVEALDIFSDCYYLLPEIVRKKGAKSIHAFVVYKKGQNQLEEWFVEQMKQHEKSFYREEV